MGNLTYEPELRYTPSGNSVCTLRIAETPRYQDDEGNWQNGETEFWDVECWRQMAENVAETLQKGDRIVATGTFYKRTWTDKESQEERERIYLRASDIGASLLFRSAKLDRTQRSKSH